MTYARARLWLGISGVGTFVVLASAGIALDLPGALDGYGDVSALVLALLAYALISLPFDLLGGFLLPKRFGRKVPSTSRFAIGWSRGVLLQAVVMLGAGLLVLAAGRVGGVGAAAAVYAAGMVALILFQAPLARLVGGLKLVERRDGVTLLSGEDEGFTGGVVGPPGAARVIVPAHWQAEFGGETTRIAIARRQSVAESASRTRGLVWAVLWNIAGFLLAATLVPGAGVATASGLISLSLGAVLWSFVGLLLLPSLSRASVLEADRRALERAELPQGELVEAIGALDRLQDDEPERSRWIERVFHPLPSVRNRVDALEQGRLPAAAAYSGWHTARNALYLSWACLGFLSRAVHCNAGRPALWVMLPAD